MHPGERPAVNTTLDHLVVIAPSLEAGVAWCERTLGVTLFQLLTGRLPCEADSLGALMRAIARETPPNVCELRADLPPALGDVVALALQKHPATRYSSGEQMAEDLRAVLKMLPDAGSPGVDISLA